MSARFFPDEMPRPQADAETLPFWRAAAEHRLVLQECSACGRLRHPPGPVCPGCRSRASGWRELSGRGSVYSYTIVHRPAVPAQRERGPLPFAVVLVELEGAQGLRIVSNLVAADPGALRVGLPVELVWEDLGPELALPRFRPARSAGL
jgi:uncharacterized OB-fold protein